MSTRCQVKVTNGEESLTLYHHTDGYPDYMLPTIKKAWEKYGQGWEGARVYKVASMLCAVDPIIFEPLDYHGLHPDIKYYYIINCKNESHVGAKPVWEIEIYTVNNNWKEQIGGKPKQELKQLYILSVKQATEGMGNTIEGLKNKENK